MYTRVITKVSRDRVIGNNSFLCSSLVSIMRKCTMDYANCYFTMYAHPHTAPIGLWPFLCDRPHPKAWIMFVSSFNFHYPIQKWNLYKTITHISECEKWRSSCLCGSSSDITILFHSLNETTTHSLGLSYYAMCDLWQLVKSDLCFCVRQLSHSFSSR